jgi:hypothetical protein
MPFPTRAPRRPLSPALWSAVEASKKSKSGLAIASGFPQYILFFTLLRSELIPATPQNLARLERVAHAVGFPTDDLFLDGPA